jgi:hypothetical protein
MKRILKLSISFFLTLLIASVASSFSSGLFIPAGTNAKPDTEIAKPSPFAGMTINDFIALTPKKYKELTGKKLSLPQKLSLKLAQYKVKKMVRKNRKVDLLLIARDVDTNNFDILGFILGIALGPIGVLIAYLIEGKSSSTFTWSVIGALIWLGVFLLVVLVL